MTKTPAWQALADHAAAARGRGFDTLFAADAARVTACRISVDGLRLAYAFQNVDAQTVGLLTALAAQQKVADWRAHMFAGGRINATENRAVLHTALRQRGDAPVLVDGVDIIPEMRAVQKRMAAFVDDVRSGQWRGATGKPMRHIVNIGIGGSDLGPRMAALALRPFVTGVDVHFVANVDAFDLNNVLDKIDAAQTLFVVASKTFTTQETLLNARSARQWLVEKLGEGAVKKHFVAVSVNAGEVEKFGIHADNMFPMWGWVGGRYSLWSAVGLSLALAIGNAHFRALLDGAAAMDDHFRTAPLEANMPVMMAMLGIWNRNFLGMPALAVLPYCERLRELPRYLQQLEMESNGKSVTRAGAPVQCDTTPALFGECGTVGQHSFHQWLHQGTTPVAADFIGVARDDLGKPEHHRALMSNMAAQMAALAFGQKRPAAPHDNYPGGRASSLILVDDLTPRALGMLLALYEHKVFVQGVVWDINSFDQPGVELGKRLAKGLESGSLAEGSGMEKTVLAGFYDAFLSGTA
ncbi:MAG: glucose-6-phosphate isomerase [Alphaproteobacteria bacterium]|nr:glucose-6-phosphate isomerase [Alphaproteobacteria bacterium]